MNSSLSVETSSVQSSSSPNTEDKRIAYAGEKFCFAHDLWLKRETIQKPCPPGMDPNCPSCYDDDNKVEEIALLTELMDSLSLSLQSMLETPSLKVSFTNIVSPVFFDLPLADLLCKFWTHYKAQRGQLVSKACNSAGSIFGLGSVSAKHVQSADSLERSNDPELQVLLRDPNNPGEMYPLLALVLFPNKDCDDIKELFQVTPLMKVRHRILLCQCSRH